MSLCHFRCEQDVFKVLTVSVFLFYMCVSRLYMDQIPEFLKNNFRPRALVIMLRNVHADSLYRTRVKRHLKK